MILNKDISLGQWLINHISNTLTHKPSSAFIIWCDPDRTWKKLLELSVEKGGFELWADECHELELRQRFLIVCLYCQ